MKLNIKKVMIKTLKKRPNEADFVTPDNNTYQG